MKMIIFTGAILLGIGIDQLAKVLVFRSIPMGTTSPVWPDILHFTPSENPGVAFSWFGDSPMAVLCISLIAVPILIWWVWQGWKMASKALLASQVLLMIGAFGNLIDRILPPHRVRDFLDFRPEIPLVGHWAIFNVADVCICLGAGLLLISELFLVRGDQKKETVDVQPEALGSRNKA